MGPFLMASPLRYRTLACSTGVPLSELTTRPAINPCVVCAHPGHAQSAHAATVTTQRKKRIREVMIASSRYWGYTGSRAMHLRSRGNSMRSVLCVAVSCAGVLFGQSIQQYNTGTLPNGLGLSGITSGSD